MALDTLFTDIRSIFTVISFATFVGIMLWAYSRRRDADFEAASLLPFADDDAVRDDSAGHLKKQATEKHNG